MKILLFIGLLFLCSCTMTVPKPIKAQNLIKRYLDSVNKSDKVRFSKFGNLLTFDADYMNHQNELTYKSDPNYKMMTDSEKVAFRSKVDIKERNFKGYEMFCMYSVNSVTHTTLFKIDTAFTKIKYIVEMSTGTSK